MTIARSTILWLVLGGALAAPAAGHDFWINPSTFTPAPGERVTLGLAVGDDPPGEPVAAHPRRTVRFVAVGPSGRAEPVAGAPGARPAGELVVAGSGVWAVGYRSTDSFVELPAGDFERYLEEEGLGHVSRARAERGHGDRPGRELFSRSVKTLLVTPGAGQPAGEAWSRPLGLTFELVPETGPFDPAPADGTPFRVLYEGAPLPGVLVEARPLGPSAPAGGTRSEPASAVSDGEGRVRVPIAGEGPWLVTAVTMHQAPPGSGADWRSVWTSLTFAPARR